EDAVFTPVLRRDRAEAESFTTGLAQLHVRGVKLDWQAVFAGTGAQRVDLPTYAFQYERYWLEAPPVLVGDAAAAQLGLDLAEHPLLGACVALADADGVLFTGRLSLEAHPWLADHAVGDTVLLPGTAFVELAVRAGDQVGCGRVEELTLEAPLVLPAKGGTQVQVSVGEPDSAGRRPVSMFSRVEDAPLDEPWTRHATGLLVEGGAAESFDLVEWPPAGAEPVPVDGLYEGFAGAGFGYGPVFQGLRAAWRRDGEVFAEIALPEDVRDTGAAFGLHPALLDAALHGVALGGLVADTGQGRLPFAWSSVCLYASGASELRVRLARAGEDAVSLAVADGTGAPVASVESLVLRPFAAEQLAGAGGGHESLFRPEWVGAVLPSVEAPDVVTVLGADDLGLEDAEQFGNLAELRAAVSAGLSVPGTIVVPVLPEAAQDVAAATRAAVHDALALVKEWLAEDLLADTRLVVVTRGAVATVDAEAPNLPSAAVRGLLGSAQSENPGRIVLVDLDEDPASLQALPGALASGEPQLAVRAGDAFAPRLARVPAIAEAEPLVLDPEGTVLVTGATGTLGALFARHLV
ncbi:polyketide synthase dehydratase domain-containing protein, partial [Kitasatospora cystarginea]|uniref:polyketide synthase dehydratase domain-containing protein n=1 Tax=Kitasatospora cystarginea TaxID=58350 RepID=UPI0031CE3FA4